MENPSTILTPEQSLILDLERQCRVEIQEVCTRLRVRPLAELVICPPLPAQNRVYVAASEQVQSKIILQNPDIDARVIEAENTINAICMKYGCVAVSSMKVNATGMSVSPLFVHYSRLGLERADVPAAESDQAST